RLSARGDASAAAELNDVQRLAREAVREVREAVTGDRTPNLAAELAAAEAALRAAGVRAEVDAVAAIEPAHEDVIARALREAVTNVVKHSRAGTCRIKLRSGAGMSELEVLDDGLGPKGAGKGTGLPDLADQVRAAGGVIEVGPGPAGGFRLVARIGVAAGA